MSAEAVVREFCASVSKRDEGLVRPLLADDVVYHNIGMDPSVGIDATVENLAGQWAMFATTYEFEVRHGPPRATWSSPSGSTTSDPATSASPSP